MSDFARNLEPSVDQRLSNLATSGEVMAPRLSPRMAIRVRVSDPTGMGMGMIFYPWVAPVPDPN
jgi:hypothetical protein